MVAVPSEQEHDAAAQSAYRDSKVVELLLHVFVREQLSDPFIRRIESASHPSYDLNDIG
jgi:hypothetical protein